MGPSGSYPPASANEQGGRLVVGDGKLVFDVLNGRLEMTASGCEARTDKVLLVRE